MICEQCKYVFIARESAVSLYDRKIIDEHLTRFVAHVVCPRCGFQQFTRDRSFDLNKWKLKNARSHIVGWGELQDALKKAGDAHWVALVESAKEKRDI